MRGGDHVPTDLQGRLVEACPNGIDRHFEKVGLKIIDPVFALANLEARIVPRGMIQHYGDEGPIYFDNFRKLLPSSIPILLFSIFDADDRQPSDLAGWKTSRGAACGVRRRPFLRALR